MMVRCIFVVKLMLIKLITVIEKLPASVLRATSTSSTSLMA